MEFIEHIYPDLLKNSKAKTVAFDF